MKRNFNPKNSSAHEFWDLVATVSLTSNEAAVELHVILPFLSALGFKTDEVAAKVPVELREGTKRGRPFEADFVAYSSALHSRDTSLLVIEAKAPGGSLEEARKQGESYAMALRAPALLVTDGLTLQVWHLQATLENRLVFDCPFSELKSKRGVLEQLIGKQALIAHSANLAHKELALTPRFEKYESAEIARTIENNKAIERILVSDKGIRVNSSDLLKQFPLGAVITAPSGYGKTTLATALLRHGIQRRWDGQESALPVDIPLIDLHVSNLTFIDYVHDRIIAHIPQSTVSALTDVARCYGLLLICDGYDRLEPTARFSLDSQLRQIVRDYPKSKLFLFSRGVVAPHLSLPRLRLESLNLEERKTMATKIIGANFPLSLMPRLLLELSEIPLLLERIIAFWAANGRFPSRLDELFDHWVQQLIDDSSTPATTVILRRVVLSTFARELGVRSLTPTDALAVSVASGGSHQTLDALVQCGALTISSTSVAFIHEGLADHLRACELAGMSQSDFHSALSAVNVNDESLLPVLLAARIKDPASRKHIWRRLREMPLPRYIDAIRFSNDTGGISTIGCPPQVEQNFVEEMSNSIEALVDTFFPAISSELRGCLTNQADPVEGICLIAKLSEQPYTSVAYSLQASAFNTIQIAQPSREMSRRYINLFETGIGTCDGRYMGAVAVRDALNDLVAQRRFRGGVTLANERTIGRLRFLTEEYDFSCDPREGLPDLLARLQPMKHMYAGHGSFGSYSPAFTIASMIQDVELLIENGYDELSWWWLRYGATDKMLAESQMVEGLVQEHYRRTMALYMEIVSTSFGQVSDQFSLFKVSPVRWDIAVVPSLHSRLPTQYWRWLPVPSEAEAGSDVRFYEHPPEDFIYGEAHESRLDEEMRRLGRSVNHYAISGSKSIPDTGTRDWRGRRTGETSAMREAVKYLEEDVKFLFRDLHAHTATLGDIPGF
jgi:hypothetical protein